MHPVIRSHLGSFLEMPSAICVKLYFPHFLLLRRWWLVLLRSHQQNWAGQCQGRNSAYARRQVHDSALGNENLISIACFQLCQSGLQKLENMSPYMQLEHDPPLLSCKLLKPQRKIFSTHNQLHVSMGPQKHSLMSMLLFLKFALALLE